MKDLIPPENEGELVAVLVFFVSICSLGYLIFLLFNLWNT